MAVSFATNWYDEIAAESTKAEYQTAVIRIEDPSLVTYGEYDVETGKQEVTGDPVIYPTGDGDGRARIIGVRWGVFSGGESQANAKTISSVRVQIPKDAVDRVKKGCKVFIESTPENPALEGLMLTVTSDFQGASSASRTLECALDGDYSGE